MIFNNVVALLMGVFFLTIAELAWSETPLEKLKRKIADLQLVIAEYPSDGDGYMKEKWRKKVFESIREAFDYRELAKTSLGENYIRYQDREEEFLEAFTNFVGRSLAYNLELYRDFKVNYLSGAIDNLPPPVTVGIVAVEFELSQKGGGTEKGMANFEFHKVDGKWKIFNIVSEGFAILKNYRSQFSRKIEKDSFDGLLQELKRMGFQKEKEVRNYGR
jgi:ABC-type transporter MlaC component